MLWQDSTQKKKKGAREEVQGGTAKTMGHSEVLWKPITEEA